MPAHRQIRSFVTDGRRRFATRRSGQRSGPGAACGPKGKHDPQRTAVRHGAGRGSVVLGGRRVPVTRPRARTTDGTEVPVAAYQLFAAEDQLTQVVMERMLAGLATRRHVAAAEPVGAVVAQQAMAISRSAV